MKGKRHRIEYWPLSFRLTPQALRVVLELGLCTPHFFAHWLPVRLSVGRGHQRETGRLEGEKGQTFSWFFPVPFLLAETFKITLANYLQLDDGSLFYQ